MMVRGACGRLCATQGPPANDRSTQRAALRCAAQVAFADKCLLNKIDLVTPAEKREVIDRIKVGMGAGFR
jgi:G3E family GTPase